MKSTLKNARLSPKKMNLIAGLVRGEPAAQALDRLRLTPKKSAKMLLKALASAIANAKNNFDQPSENLFVKSIIVTKGITLKRGMPISRGRTHPLHRHNCHVTIEIGVNADKAEKSTKEGTKTPKVAKKTTPKASKAPASTNS